MLFREMKYYHWLKLEIYITVLIHLAQAGESYGSHPSFSVSYEGKYLVGHVIRNRSGLDWFRCTMACLEEPRCVSYNYRARGGECELNDYGVRCNVDTRGELRVATGVIYHQIKRMTSECTGKDEVCDHNSGTESDCHVANEHSTELGESPHHLAESCNSIYTQRNPPPPNGAYYIRTGNTPLEYSRVYCHMDNLTECGGEGWTLVMKIDGQKDTFRYEATEYWQDQRSYNECACRDLGSSECKLATFWSTKIKKGICLGMQYNGTTSWIKFRESQGHGDETLQDKMKGRPVSSPLQNLGPGVDVIAREWRKLLPNPALEFGCGIIQGIKVALVDGSAKTRIGVFGLPTYKCEKGASWIGFGFGGKLRGLNESISCGNLAPNKPPVKAMGFILVQ